MSIKPQALSKHRKAGYLNTQNSELGDKLLNSDRYSDFRSTASRYEQKHAGSTDQDEILSVRQDCPRLEGLDLRSQYSVHMMQDSSKENFKLDKKSKNNSSFSIQNNDAISVNKANDTLDLSNQQIVYVAEQLLSNPRLKVVRLSSNRIKSLPDNL